MKLYFEVPTFLNYYFKSRNYAILEYVSKILSYPNFHSKISDFVSKNRKVLPNRTLIRKITNISR